MEIVKVKDPLNEIVDGNENKKNIAKYDELVRREAFLRSVIAGNKVSNLYKDALKKEIDISFKLRNLLCFLCYRGTESVTKINYVVASDGCEISDVYLKRYEADLNEYNKQKKLNNKHVSGLTEMEKTFEVERANVKKAYSVVRDTLDKSNNPDDFRKLCEEIQDEAVRAVYSDAKELIPLFYMAFGKYNDLTVAKGRKKV